MYPDGDALIPEAFDEHTIAFLVRPPDAPALSEEELDRLQEEHLTYLRDLQREGVLIANGPLTAQTDERLRGVSIYALPLHQALELARDDPSVRAGRLAIDGATWLTAHGTAHFGRPAASKPPAAEADAQGHVASSRGEARFAALVEALGGQDGVAVGAAGRGFGAGSLQVDGRIFAMMSGDRLVLKLAAPRVEELVASGEGLPFDAGNGRPMKEWVALLDRDDVPWRELAFEALAFVGKRD